MTKMVKPMCLKLMNGETIFSEIIMDDASTSDLTKLYLPHVVSLLSTSKGEIQFVIRPWVPFTDDLFHYISPNNILNASSLDRHHLKLYGSLVVKHEIEMVYNTVVSEAKQGIINSLKFQAALDTMHKIMEKSHLLYEMNVPSKSEIDSSFYKFVMDQTNNTVEYRS